MTTRRPWRRAVFLAALERKGTVVAACRDAEVSRTAVYNLVASDPHFAEQVRAAQLAWSRGDEERLMRQVHRPRPQ